MGSAVVAECHLSPDKGNSVTLQLTAGDAMWKEGCATWSISVHKSDVFIVVAAFSACAESEAATTCKDVLAAVAVKMNELTPKEKVAVRESAPTITTVAVVAALEEFNVSEEPGKQKNTSMVKFIRDRDVGRARKKSMLDDLKARTKCLACGKHGHWFRQNEASMATIRQKMASTDKKDE